MAADSTCVAFDCLMCGRCCEGSGGIILSAKDLERICAHMGLSAKDFSERYAEQKRGKLGIKAGSDGFCVFFKKDRGCTVHQGRPDICRAWPYFKGNLTDPVSLEMAREDCPGINRKISFAGFREQGLNYLREHQLLHDGEPDAPNALNIKE
ncbi:YkgJ family cysteine cluster protein [Desulfovibrio sp. OttesenSCG-928-C06]|nr:YkgJ family cysteine cluster protein [Desulfovibrio sp. OttesenSCG-928-C06]